MFSFLKTIKLLEVNISEFHLHKFGKTGYVWFFSRGIVSIPRYAETQNSNMYKSIFDPV